MTTMNSIMFMPRIIRHCGQGGNIVDLPSVLLTFAIVGVILIMLGILANILHAKFSQGFGTPIRWADIKPTFDNSFLGCFCGFFGIACLGVTILTSLVVGVYWCVVSL